MDNYPDDIRMYDDDPRSPFYEEKATTTDREDYDECAAKEAYYEEKYSEKFNQPMDNY